MAMEVTGTLKILMLQDKNAKNSILKKELQLYSIIVIPYLKAY